jgi:trimeric autotransporter adhesin
VTVSPLAANIPVGETDQFTATGHYSDGSTQDLTDSVTWASSSSATATVSNASGSQGLVTAVADGATTITATDPTTSIEGIAAVTVLPAVLLAVTVSPTAATIAQFGTQQFTATGHYSDLSTKDLTDSVTWSSSSDSVATISNSAGSQGLATGVSTGDVVITATDPSSAVFGVAALDVGGVKLTITPSTGPPRTHVTVTGQGFTPGSKIKVIYKTGVSTEPSIKICSATVATDGTFSCTGKIRGTRRAGSPGSHTVNAKARHTHTVIASTTYTLS